MAADAGLQPYSSICVYLSGPSRAPYDLQGKEMDGLLPFVSY